MLPFLAFALAAGHALLDASLWHTGFSDWDEAGQVGLLQLHREGQALPWSFGRGCWHRLLCAGALELAGPSLAALRVPALLGLGLQGLGLYLLARRLFGLRAACWAAALALCAAGAVAGGRSLLGFTLWPAELAVMLGVLPLLGSAGAQAAWGAAAGLLLLDYEGWAVTLPVLVLAWRSLSPFRRPGPALAAFALAATGVALLSLPHALSYLMTRASTTVAPAAELGALVWGSAKTLLLGGPALTFLGVRGHPVLPPLLWPLILAGAVAAWRGGPRWILAWAALGLLPAGLRDSPVEPQRFLGAWLAAALLAGAGAQVLAERFGKAALAALALAFAANAALEAAAFQRGMRDGFAAQSGLHHHWRLALRGLARAQAGQPLRLLTDLGSEDGAPLRFLADEAGLRRGQESGLAAVALVPWQYAPAAMAATAPAQWSFVGDLEGAWPAHVLRCAPEGCPRLVRVEAELGKRWRALAALPRIQAAELCLAMLEGAGPADPWVRTALAERALDLNRYVGRLDARLSDRLAAGALVSATVHEELALFWERADPARALASARSAVAVDPRRLSAWHLRARMLKRAGRAAELEALLQELGRRRADFRRALEEALAREADDGV